jgi:hypothetical protein
MRFGKNPNQPEAGVNLRQHVIRTDTDGFTMKTGERERRTQTMALGGGRLSGLCAPPALGDLRREHRSRARR